MSGNQQPQISLPTWRYSDFNAAIPIKKRKYFVQPEAAGASALLDNNNPQGDTRSALDPHVSQKMIGEGSRMNIGKPIPSLSPSVSAGKNADKPESVVGNLVPDQIRVKVEEPVNSSALAASSEVPPSSSDIVGNSLHSSLGKLPMRAEQHSGVLKTRDIVRETCGNETLRGECQTQASAGAGTVALRLGSMTPYLENQEPTALNLSLSKGVCAPHDPDFISTCTEPGIHNVVSRSNWDLNTTMDAWEDGLDRKTRVKTSGAFLNSNNNTGCPDMETSINVIAKSVSEKQKEHIGVKSPTVALPLFDHQVKSTSSLSLGLGAYPPVEKSPSLSATTSEARSSFTSSSRPVMIAGNVNSVNLRTVKSEVIDESVQVDPIGNRVSQDVVVRLRQENSLGSGSLKPVDSVSVKAEPNNFTQSVAFSRKDGTLNHLHRPLVESNDLPTSFTPNQKDEYIPSSSGIGNALMSLNVMTRNPGQSSGQGDHNLNASGVNDTVTKDKVLDDCKTYVSPDTDELPMSGEEKIVLSGKDDEKVQRPVAMLTEGNENEQRDITVPSDGNNQGSQAALLGNTGYNEGRIVQGGEHSTHQTIHASEGVSGVSTLSGGNGDNPETVDNNNSPVSHKAEMSTFDDDPLMELSEGSPNRVKTLDASDSFAERDRLPDFSLGQRKYHSRWSDESCSFSRERYHGKAMRSPRLNFMPHKRRFSDDTESNLHERDTKNFESNSYENTRRGRGGGAFTFNSYRGRRPANDEGTSFPNSFTRRNGSFSYRPTNKEDASEFHGFRDGEKFTRGMQSNSTEQQPMFMTQSRPYRGRNSFGRGGRTNFSNNSKRDFHGFRSRSPVRSRDRSAGPSSSFRNRSEEDFSGNTEFSRRRSPSGYRTGRLSSPEHSGYPREGFVRRHNSPPYSHRPSNAGRGRGYERGRGYARGRGYGRDGISFRKPYDRGVHRNLNNFDPRERVDYSDGFFEGPMHSERFGVDGDAERRQFGYIQDGASSFRRSFNNDGCAPPNVEGDPDVARFGQNPGVENRGEQGSLVETDGKNMNSSENASGRSQNMEEDETSKHSEIWQQDELGGGGDGF